VSDNPTFEDGTPIFPNRVPPREGPPQLERDMKFIAAEFEKLAKNVCPHCDGAIARQEQVGRCVYARPCGHRLYQGTVGAFAPNQGAKP